MQDTFTNILELTGHVLTKPVKSHELFDEVFYTFNIEVKRLSFVSDILPVTVSEKTLSLFKIDEGDLIKVTGQLRSYNHIKEGSSKLVLTVFCKKLSPSENEFENDVSLMGYVCRKPTYRITPFGREITDLLLAVNRAYNKSDYIPLIVWGKNARLTSDLQIGDRIRIEGRLQSREYEKVLDTKKEIRTAYEVSVSTITLPDKKVLEKTDS
ncbi:MAG: single-stranded DNA-binding protein [Eubacteriales bacterium]